MFQNGKPELRWKKNRHTCKLDHCCLHKQQLNTNMKTHVHDPQVCSQKKQKWQKWLDPEIKKKVIIKMSELSSHEFTEKMCILQYKTIISVKTGFVLFSGNPWDYGTGSSEEDSSHALQMTWPLIPHQVSSRLCGGSDNVSSFTLTSEFSPGPWQSHYHNKLKIRLRLVCCFLWPTLDSQTDLVKRQQCSQKFKMQ